MKALQPICATCSTIWPPLQWKSLPELKGWRFLKVSLTYQDVWKRPQPFLCHCLAFQGLLTLSTAGSYFSSLPFASCICRSPSCCLPCHGRFNPTTPLSNRIFLLLLGHLALIPSLVCFLFNSEFFPELLVQLCGPPVMFVGFPVLWRRPFFNLKEEDLWKSTSSSGTFNLYDCLLWDSSKQTPEHEKIWTPGLWSYLLALFLLWRFLNSTFLWSLQKSNSLLLNSFTAPESHNPTNFSFLASLMSLQRTWSHQYKF